MSYVQQAGCDPCLKYCQRIAYPYVGILGWLGYIPEAVTVVWVAFMWIGVASQDYRIILGLLLGTILLDFLFWAINLFRCAPCYATRILPSRCSPCGCELIVKGDPCDYADGLRMDLRHTNDQWHLQATIMKGLFVLFFFGWYVGVFGAVTFDLLTDPPTAQQIMFYVIAKTIQLAIIGAIGWSFTLLVETHSDLMWRHFTALPSLAALEESGALSNKRPLGRKGGLNNF